MTEINTVINQIHEWGHRENPFLKREALTRFGGIGCATLEAVYLTVKPLLLGLNVIESLGKIPLKGARILFPRCEKLKKFEEKLPSPQDLWNSAKKISDLFLGFLSTIFYGIIVSPEKNFKNHVRLGLAHEPVITPKEILGGWGLRLSRLSW